jgi:hypothetical protein
MAHTLSDPVATAEAFATDVSLVESPIFWGVIIGLCIFVVVAMWWFA